MNIVVQDEVDGEGDEIWSREEVNTDQPADGSMIGAGDKQE